MKGIFFTVFIFLTHQLMATSINFSSTYVDRGETLNNGLVIQPNIEENVHGIAVGVWGNIDIQNKNKERLSEIELYINKDILLKSDLNVSLGYAEILLPNESDAEDRESEVSLTATKQFSNYHLSASVFSDIYTTSEPNYYEGEINSKFQIVGLDFDYGAKLGYFVSSKSGSSGFGYSSYSLSYNCNSSTTSIHIINEIDNKVCNVETEFVISMNYDF